MRPVGQCDVLVNGEGELWICAASKGVKVDMRHAAQYTESCVGAPYASRVPSSVPNVTDVHADLRTWGYRLIHNHIATFTAAPGRLHRVAPDVPLASSRESSRMQYRGVWTARRVLERQTLAEARSCQTPRTARLRLVAIAIVSYSRQ